MFSYLLWKDFKYSCKERYIGYADKYYKYSNNELAESFIFNIILTPFCILVDLVVLPFEFIYLITLKVINKLRKEIK